MNSDIIAKVDRVIAAGPFKNSWDSLEAFKAPK